MKKGISLILIIIMIFIVIMLASVCLFVINNNFSFFNLKEYSNVKTQIQEQVNNIIFTYENHIGRDMVIVPGYINTEEAPKIQGHGYTKVISVEDVNIDFGELKELKVYLNEKGIIQLKYLFFYI